MPGFLLFEVVMGILFLHSTLYPWNSIKRMLIFHCSCIILQKHMADVEVRAAELVIEACVRTQSVKRCVFTSSLLACVWQVNTTLQNSRHPTIVDENCWSDQSVCYDKKVHTLNFHLKKDLLFPTWKCHIQGLSNTSLMLVSTFNIRPA